MRGGWRSAARVRRAVAVAALAVACLSLRPGPAAAQSWHLARDLGALSIEQLLNVDVYTASKFTQKASEAPSAVSVVTAADIQRYGYRTLADILKSIRGLYVSYDRNYTYLGVRGFSRPGDYNTRILLLVDGYRTNDSVFDQASVGAEFAIDVDLIERVEFAPGPSSSIYGANAFFGVINVITRRTRDFKGVEVSGEAGSFSHRRGRVSYGNRLDNGLEVVLSATGHENDGEDLFFPEFGAPATNNGIAAGLDYERMKHLFAKLSYRGFTFGAARAERKKGVPTASFGQVFNDPRSHTLDEQTFLDLNYYGAVADRADVAARLYYGRYDYTGDYVYDYPPLTVNRDGSRGRWWGAELRLATTRFDKQKLVLGAEYQRDTRRDQFNFDVDPPTPYLDDRRSGDKYGFYVQDEITLGERLLLNAGARHDRNSTTGGITNPRLALIYRPWERGTLKLLYGTAYRAPNAFELYYQFPGPGGAKANPALKPERIRTYEAVLEHQLQPNTRLSASVFRYRITDLINQVLDPADGLLAFRNIDEAEARGAEFELERLWENGARLRASYAWQLAKDRATGQMLANSPRHLGKLNLSIPLAGERLQAGVEAQYVGARRSLAGEAGAHAVVNLTLLARKLAKGLELSASIYNLLDREYADPGSGEHVQDTLQQDGHSLRLKLTWSF